MIEQGQFNILEIYLGVPGTGKSTAALQRAIELGKGAYVFAHDPGWRLPETLPTGAASGLRRHESLAQVQDALRTDPRGIHCIPSSDASTVLTTAVDVSRKNLQASQSIGPNKKKVAFPSVALIDEGVMARGADRYRLDGQFGEAITQRRHLHVGLLITYQSANLCHYQLLTQATKIVCFRMHDQRDLMALSRVGFTPDECETIRRLPDFQCHVHALR